MEYNTLQSVQCISVRNQSSTHVPPTYPYRVFLLHFQIYNVPLRILIMDRVISISLLQVIVGIKTIIEVNDTSVTYEPFLFFSLITI